MGWDGNGDAGADGERAAATTTTSLREKGSVWSLAKKGQNTEEQEQDTLSISHS